MNRVKHIFPCEYRYSGKDHINDEIAEEGIFEDKEENSIVSVMGDFEIDLL